MKRGKDEEKFIGPMFPRLHVNDTEKGGPRAPPRNKMALYEQLSIPFQSFSHVMLPCNPNNSVPPLNQGGGKNRGAHSPQQGHPRHPSARQYSPYSELSTPFLQVEQSEKLDEDDYRVPIFIHPIPTEFDKYRNNINPEEFSPSNPPHFPPTSKFQKAKETGVLENSMQQEGKNKKGEHPKEFVAGRKQTVSLLSHEPGDDIAKSIDRSRTDDGGQPELCAESQDSQLFSDTAKINLSKTMMALPSEDQNIVHDLSSDTGSREDGSCSPVQTRNLERGDSVSESSILDNGSVQDITPDDVVGIIGQKLFWKARRAITNQQRIFAVQVFELHRLIKVQRLIAASPHLLLEESVYFGKPKKPLSGKKRQLDYALKAISNASRGKSDSDNPSRKKECSAENTVEKATFPSALNGVPPPSCIPLIGSSPTLSVVGSDQHTRTQCLNHPQAPPWLVPVLSPTEGLVYKPYPGTEATSNSMIGNFLSPAYGVPAPSPQYPFPSFPPFRPHCYFPPYSMPIMITAAFSDSPVEQANPTPIPGHPSAGEATSNVPTQKDLAVPDRLRSHAAEEIEVQASTASSLNERQPTSRVSNAVEGRNKPSPAVGASNACSQLFAPVWPTRVIKVVPRNGSSASESAARIFRSIQEEREQHDSV